MDYVRARRTTTSIGVKMEITKKDIEVMARTVWAESRGEIDDGKLAVAHVIRNRAEKGGWWGNTLEEVCKKPWQFSCWNEGDPNKTKLLSVDAEDEMARDSLWACLAVVQGKHEDPTSGSCHYHTADILPDWAEGKNPVCWIGNHLFYNDID